MMANSMRYIDVARHTDTTVMKTSRSAFVIFKEAPISFLPTCRMLKQAEGHSNKNNQNPPYTDRVLVRSGPGATPAP